MSKWRSIVVAGGRDFGSKESHVNHFIKKMDELFPCTDNLVIVSGGARGADALGEAHAWKRHIPLAIFRANWNKYGRAAGVIRNKQMLEFCDGVVVFWDGSSKGTANMRDLAVKAGKLIGDFDYGE